MIQIACMTLPYAHLPFERALQGIAQAGYRYVAFGLPHERIAVPDETDVAAVDKLRALFDRYALKPVMLVSTEQLAPSQPIERARSRFAFAKALGIREIITLGTWEYETFPNVRKPAKVMAAEQEAFIAKMKQVAAIAEETGIILTTKPHTGNTATARILANTVAAIDSPAFRASYDPGNVQFYEGIDAAEDFPAVAEQTVSIVAKDHRGARANADFPLPGDGDVNFVRLMKDWRENQTDPAAEYSLVIERVDGTGGEMTAEEIDDRIAQSRLKLLDIVAKAGYGSNEVQ